MSNTYKHKNMGKYNREFGFNSDWFKATSWKTYRIAWERDARPLWQRAYGYSWACATPHVWNNIIHERPMRRAVKRALKDVTLDNMGEEILLPVFKKPHIYYW